MAQKLGSRKNIVLVVVVALMAGTAFQGGLPANAQRRTLVERYSPLLLSPTADGDLDTSFWSGQSSVPAGVARVFFGATAVERTDSATAIGIQSTGNIIIGGVSQGPGVTNDYALARFNGTNGNLDTTFGTSGKVLGEFVTGQQDNLIGLAVDTTRTAGDPLLDSIIIVGSTDSPGPCGFSSTNRDFAVARYTAAGVLDTTFNTGGLNGTGGQSGKYIKDFHGCNDFANRVVIQPVDHKIVIMGTSFDPAGAGTSYIELLRLMPDGTPDPTFNGGVGANTSGRVEQNVAPLGSSSTVTDFVRVNAPIAQDGKFLTLSASTAATSEFLVARFTSVGALDGTFGTGGKTVVSFAGGSVNEAASLAVQPSDGKILAAGQTGDAKFAMARWDSSGTLDSAGFGSGGKVIETFPTGTNMGAKFVGVMSNGQIIMSGGGTLNSAFAAVGIARYSTAGVLDTTFGTSGRVLTNLPSASTTNAATPFAGALQSDNRILAAGTINTNNGGDSDFFVARFLNAIPTAATVLVSGRVVTASGNGIRNARVTLTDTTGRIRWAITNSFGYFQITDVASGSTYLINAASRSYVFTPRVVTVNDQVTNADLTALP